MYLGDGAYVIFDGYSYVLRANHHEQSKCTDQVYLEPDVMQNLIQFVKSMGNETCEHDWRECYTSLPNRIFNRCAICGDEK